MKLWNFFILLISLKKFKSTSAELYDDQPKILVNDGNLIFESADSKNINVRLKGKSKFLVNNIDILSSLNGSSSSSNSNSGNSDMSNKIQALLDEIVALKGTIRRQNVRLEVLEYGNINANTSSNITDPSDRQRLNRFGRRIQVLEQRVANLTERLTKNHCNSYPCQNGGTCFNMFETFRCECTENYEGPMCNLDVNECARYVGTDLGCQNGATCINTLGSYECSCSEGWKGKNCNRRKVDCLSVPQSEICGHGRCIADVNKDGYSCICEQGWRKDNNSQACTQDVDECTEMRPHCSVDPKVLCINTPGSFVCGPCPSGYTGNGYYCEDINECEVNNGGCSVSPKVECINTRGSNRCGNCPLGFEGDGITCTPSSSRPTNQCADSSICNPNAICYQYPNSSPTCICKYGFTGNGFGPNGCSRFTPDPCGAMFCRNGGTCVRNGTTAYCQCPTGTNPPFCARATNECDPNPCLNGGNCTGLRFGFGFRCICPRGFSGGRCESQSSICGGVLANETGILRYPTDPSASYQHNSRCAWLIKTNTTKVLNITFISFNIEHSTECRYDWLQIHDGRSAASHIIGRFCGSTLPKGGNFVSTHNQLYLWFRSDNTTAHSGFEIKWESIDPVCGGEQNISSHGIIKSPGAPGNYPMNADCEWILLAPPGKRIQFLFYSLMIEAHTTCNYDYLEIHSGVGISSPSLGLFCNSTIPAPILTPSNTATLHFHSDGDSSDAGFQIAYSVVEGIPGCGGTYTASRGDITSPTSLDDGTYKHNLACDYVIRMPQNSRIRIEFKEFGMEDSSTCKFDKLEIYEGSEGNEEGLIGRYCGSTKPPVITSSTNIVTIKFVSDWSYSDIGFKLQYMLLCGGIYTAETGIISSPNYPNNYDGERKCEYDIIAPQGKVIVLNVLDFDIEQHSTCEFDYLQIFDSPSADNSTSLGRYCGDDKPGILTSSFNHLHIHFASDASVFGRGFQANYSFVDVRCGGLIKDAKELVKPPMNEDENGLYESNAVCKWLIFAPRGYVIQMNVLDFELEHDSHCKYDYLEIYNNGSGNGEKIGPYCGTTIPKVITTVDNIATILFVSDSSTSKDGFTISFNFIDGSKLCGGSFYSTHGSLKSPGTPQYLANKNCEWTISVPNGQQIQVNFKYFDIEPHSTCRFDVLEVRNGGNNLAPLLGRFCGKEIPPPFKSMSNQLHFKFVSDSSHSGAGFELEWDGTTMGCGGIVSSVKGAITSPNYPQNYAHNAQCEWRISVNEGSTIHIVFSDLDFEVNAECKYDYLEIFDGSDASARSLGKFCEEHPMHIETTSNHALIRMNTDDSHAGRGFHIKYSTNCNRTIEADTGVIESPNFPDDYPNYLDCMWTIRVPRGNKVNMEFSHFSLENDNLYHNSTNDHICKYDYVTIYDYDFEASDKKTQTQKSYCNKAPDIRNSTTDAVVVLFHTDQAAVASGFRLEWSNIGCGGRLTHKSGSLLSPNYPQRYDHDYTCIWEISVEYGYNINITINDFEVERSTECQFDSLVFSHDKSFNSSIITKLCDSLRQPMNILSDGHQVFVKFVTDESHSGKGFNITYESVISDCGGFFSATNGVIKTPSYPTKNYDNNKTCEWRIATDPSHSIIFELTDFDIQSSINCEKDALEIYDPIFNETLWKGCGSDMPNTTVFKSKRNELVLRLTTDGYINAKGFQGNYSINCGSRIVTDDSGEIAYRKSTENIECEWSIIASDPSKHVTLTFTYLELFFETDFGCLLSITVFEGDVDSLGAQRASFCGSKTPSAIISNGNALTIKLNTSSLGYLSEFDVHYSVLDNACGGNYKQSTHSEFASPNYPQSTPLNTYCIWTISANVGNKLSLSFKNFDVANSQNCNENYLEIRKNSANGDLIDVFCGDKKPINIESSQGYWIKYKTDDSSSNNGFMAEYKYITHSDLQGMNGIIESPNYPNYIRKDHLGTYRITVKQGSVIRLVFNDLYMDEEDPDDCYAKIQIYNGYDDTAMMLGEEFCHQPPEPITSEANIIFLKFRNGLHTKTKFQLEWQQVEKNYSGNVDKNSVCGKEMISLNNVTDFINITSPGYPDGYAENLDCEWTIVSGLPSYHPVISFLDVDLEDVPSCVSDYVRVSTSEKDGTWREADKMCMEDMRFRKKFHGTPNLKVDLHTDYNTNQTGFMAVTYLHCGGHLTDADGIIEYDPMRINSFRGVIDTCMWNITVRRGRKIQFEFLEINLRNMSSGGCANFITIKNGHDDSASYLGSGQYCSKAEIPQTTGNMAFVSYKVIGIQNSSFKLRFSEVQHECGGQVTLTHAYNSSIITTPNYPNIPHPHIECTWIIIAPIGEAIRIDFIDRFDLIFDAACEKEYVELREGSTGAASLIGTFCGSKNPTTKYSKSNVLRLKYFTDISEPNNGFKANVSISVCGGTIRTNDIGYLSSPKYPGLGAYPSNATCDYRIIGPISHLFTINILDVDLPTISDSDHFSDSDEKTVTSCDLEKDHMVIYSVLPDANGGEKLIDDGIFCGDEVPKNAILSESNEIIVRLNTFSRTNQLYKGFRLFYNASKLGCGGDINQDSGIITSIGYPSKTLSKAFCEWRITVTKGKRVTLEFEDIDFTTSGRFMQRIGIYNDFSYSSRMLFIVNNTNPGIILSSDNKIMITSWIRYISQNRGFKIKFSSNEETICVGDMNQDEGFIQVPNIENSTSFSCTYSRRNEPIGTEANKGTIAYYFTNLSAGRRVTNCRFASTVVNLIRDSGFGEGEKYLARICGNTTTTLTVSSPYPDMTLEVKQSPYFGRLNFTMRYKKHKCGGILKGNSDSIVITNPPANAANYNQLDCAWSVKYDRGYSASIKIQSLSLKLPCDQEYIQIYNGPSPLSPVLTKICGNEFDSTALLSQKESVFITYHTDNFASESKDSQFSIKVDSSSFGCGGILNQLSRRFNTPLYDKPYPPNSECIWELRADPGFHIGLIFTDRFFIEDSPNCTKDYVEIYDFIENEFKFMKRICGREMPKPINSTSTKMRVLFHSDDSVNGDGFNAIWEQNCGGVINVDDKKRVIASPRYPKTYVPNLSCNYTFQTKDPEDYINLKFIDFNIESANGKCFYDNVTLYKYLDYMTPPEPSKIGSYCGLKNPGSFRHKGKISIVFKTDRWVEKTGFQLEYNLDSCGGIVTNSTVIQSPQPVGKSLTPWDYLGALTCVWNITAPVDKKIILKFEKISFEYSEYCSFDFLEVFNGTLDDDSNRLMKICNNLTIPPIHIFNNEAVIKMRTDQSRDYVGFRAAVIFQQKCDESVTLTIAKSSYVIDKTNSENGNNLECTYKIIGDPMSVLRVTFNEMHLDDGDPDQHKKVCSSDYVEILDGNGPFSRFIGRYCGHDTFTDVVSTGNGLYIRFVTDGIRSRSSFKLTINMQESPCGSKPYVNLTDSKNESIIILSPRTSSNIATYPANIRCMWIIEAPERVAIEISFNQFDIEDSEGCKNDSLRIEDDSVKDYIVEGLGEELIYRGRSMYATTPNFYMGVNGPISPHIYCGSELPHEYYSSTSKIRIYFESNSQVEKKGFNMTVRTVDACARNFTALQGRLMSDSRPDTCRTTISVPENYTISLYFYRFYFYENNCEKAYLKVYDGDFERGALLKTLCGFSTPDPIFSSGNQVSLAIQFEESAGFYQRGNYDIMYVASEKSKGPGCGGEIFNYGGMFTSPLYPSSNRTNFDCTWTVRVPSNLVVALKFNIFDMGSKLTCDIDYVELLEENDAKEFVSIKKYCGDDEPAVFVSSRSQVKVHFVQTVHFAGTGWMMYFMGIHEGSSPSDW